MADIEAIDKDDKKPKAKEEPKLAAEEANSGQDCPVCHGTGLDEDALCQNCSGSGKVQA